MLSMLESDKEYTYDEYMEIEDGQRCELIDGIVYMMAPPVLWHQYVAGDIHYELKNFLKNKKCKPIVSPVGVRLFYEKSNSDKTVVQPDVIVVCDESKLSDGTVVLGAPDVVFEVMSDSTALYDLNVKKSLYEKAGVKEYWIVAKGYAIRWLLVDGVFTETKFKKDNGSISMPIATLGITIVIET